MNKTDKKDCWNKLKKTQINPDSVLLESYGFKWKTIGLKLTASTKDMRTLVRLNTEIQALRSKL